MKFEQKKDNKNFREGTLGFEPATHGLKDHYANRYATVVVLLDN